MEFKEGRVRKGQLNPDPKTPRPSPPKGQGIKAKDKKIKELQEALIWCSGSEDFGEGGKARKGWLKICKPLLEEEGDRK